MQEPLAPHQLTPHQLDSIANILAPFSASIDKVGLFGSRAMGTARSNSDVDMVLHGNIDEATIRRINTLYEESSLALKMDVHAYSLITHAPLKAHIDAVYYPIF